MYDEKIQLLYGPDFSVRDEITYTSLYSQLPSRVTPTSYYPHELDVLY